MSHLILHTTTYGQNKESVLNVSTVFMSLQNDPLLYFAVTVMNVHTTWLMRLFAIRLKCPKKHKRSSQSGRCYVII